MFDFVVAGAVQSVADAGWGVKSDGDVEFPSGRFTLVEVPEDAGARAEMREAVFDTESEAENFDTVQAGWYVVSKDEEGVFACIPFGKDEQGAQETFQSMKEKFNTLG